MFRSRGTPASRGTRHPFASRPDLSRRYNPTTTPSQQFYERATQRIVSDLVEGGYVTKTREGRRNRYQVNASMRMRHSSQRNHEIGELLDLLRLDDVTVGS